MSFGGRENEKCLIVDLLTEVRQSHSARLLAIIGRRRVGKTTLALQALKASNSPCLYFFVPPYAVDRDLINQWTTEVRRVLKLDTLPVCTRPIDLLAFLLQYAEQNCFNLILDESLTKNRLGTDFWTKFESLWMQYKNQSKLLCILIGSNQLLSPPIPDGLHPLCHPFDLCIDLKPFETTLLTQIVDDHCPMATNDDLLDLYMMTGGVAQYVKNLLFLDGDSVEWIRRFFNPYGSFLHEGHLLLTDEFNRDFGLYYGLLEQIASGVTKRQDLQAYFEGQISGQLLRLESYYHLITKHTPLLAPINQRGLRFRMTDQFLIFWLNTISAHIDLVESNRLDELKTKVEKALDASRQHALIHFYEEKLTETKAYTAIGSWWSRDGQVEIDLIAVDEVNERIRFFEIKRNPKKIDINALMTKSAAFFAANPKLRSYNATFEGLSLEDMRKPL